MNASRTQLVALVAVLAGAAQASAQTPPSPPSPAAPAAPAAPAPAPAPSPSASPVPPDSPGEARRERDAHKREMDANRHDSEARQRDQERMQRDLERAQEELNRSAREVAELSTKLHEEAWAPWAQHGPQWDMESPRSMLGINIGDQHGHNDTPTDGVKILSVSPGGAAEEAGLKANDVILSINGKPLHGDKKSSPQEQLLSQMQNVPPDTSVTIEYRRDGNVQTTKVVSKSIDEFVTARVAKAMSHMPPIVGPIHLTDHGPIVWMDGIGGFGSAELTELSPGLGHYFGTDKGLLVVRAPKDERLKLQDGDVILDIDGRVPGSPSHAYEILDSYHGGETLKVHVMRQQKKIELPIQIPEDTHGGMSRLRADGFTPFNLIAPYRLEPAM